jgi:H+-transporting ATPase
MSEGTKQDYSAVSTVDHANISVDVIKVNERAGLTTEQAEKLYETVGFNELPHVEVSLWWILFVQFTGLMPYMLELACILALAVQDWIDFAIIAAIVLCNGYLGFAEELKAKASLVSNIHFNIKCL